MSEEKLTVAELMARASKEGHSTDAPRRRRRRSLEDGGISVAELTGSIPAVKEKPAESKHSAVKIDDPAEPVLIDDSPTPAPAAAPVEDAVPAKPEAPAEAEEPAAAVDADADAVPVPVLQAKPSTPRTVPSNDETMVLSIVDEKDPIRLTTGAFPVVPTSAVKPAVPTVAPTATKEAEEAASAEFSSEEFIAASPESTTQLEAITGDIAVADLSEDDTEDSAKMSVFSVILMAVVGVVLGAVIFLAFEMLWGRLNNWLVGLLAIAVTLGMVGIVHALRTSRDGFSMILAGIVGVVMTFGPLLIVI